MRLVLAAFTLVIDVYAFGCDICGGVSSNASIGLFASTKFHTLGIRSSYRSFSTYMNGVRHSSEYLFGQEIQFRTQLHERVQLLGSFPFQSAIQMRDFGSDFISGMGDPNVISNFILVQNRDSNDVNKNFLSLGIGLKAPLGKTTKNSNGLKNLYPGTGSWDYLLLSNYTHQFAKFWGWQTEMSYSFKGKDPVGFQYGNSFQSSGQVFRNFKISSYRLIVAAGMNFEHHASSRLNGSETIGKTNDGIVLSSRASINLLTYRWLWSVTIQNPNYQNLNDGTIRQKVSGSISINYLLKTSKK
jgi:hypothetical protein